MKPFRPRNTKAAKAYKGTVKRTAKAIKGASKDFSKFKRDYHKVFK